mmetsp:Transcript_2836/g.6191  ORF Transcript_2836/g.6191 Transcript_2836/m.6191 type:complete len:90 (+) Transcript_2836:821-1090(+)
MKKMMVMNASFGHQQRRGFAFTGNPMMMLGERNGLKEFRWRGRRILDGVAVARHDDDGLVCGTNGYVSAVVAVLHNYHPRSHRENFVAK